MYNLYRFKLADKYIVGDKGKLYIKQKDLTMEMIYKKIIENSDNKEAICRLMMIKKFVSQYIPSDVASQIIPYIENRFLNLHNSTKDLFIRLMLRLDEIMNEEKDEIQTKKFKTLLEDIQTNFAANEEHCNNELTDIILRCASSIDRYDSNVETDSSACSSFDAYVSTLCRQTWIDKITLSDYLRNIEKAKYLLSLIDSYKFGQEYRLIIRYIASMLFNIIPISINNANIGIGMLSADILDHLNDIPSIAIDNFISLQDIYEMATRTYQNLDDQTTQTIKKEILSKKISFEQFEKVADSPDNPFKTGDKPFKDRIEDFLVHPLIQKSLTPNPDENISEEDALKAQKAQKAHKQIKNWIAGSESLSLYELFQNIYTLDDTFDSSRYIIPEVIVDNPTVDHFAKILYPLHLMLNDWIRL